MQLRTSARPPQNSFISHLSCITFQTRNTGPIGGLGSVGPLPLSYGSDYRAEIAVTGALYGGPGDVCYELMGLLSSDQASKSDDLIVAGFVAKPMDRQADRIGTSELSQAKQPMTNSL